MSEEKAKRSMLAAMRRFKKNVGAKYQAEHAEKFSKGIRRFGIFKKNSDDKEKRFTD